MSTTHIAQICLNGHMITSIYDKHDGPIEIYCSKCSAKTITACPNCNTPLRGYYEVEGFLVLGENVQPESYCFHCGSPYPWTEKALAYAKLIILEESSIPNEQKEALISSLPDAISETPGTTLAASRMKKFLASACSFTNDALKQFIIESGCELFKSLIF